MSELVRFGIAIDGDLLQQFDQRIERKGYQNRSEAIRDLIRSDLVEDIAMSGGDVTGSLTLVYDHHVRELSERLTDIQHDLGHHVISAMHVHLDHDHCLEVIVMRGAAPTLKSAADRILATKGVVNGRLTLTGVPHAQGAHDHDGAHAQEHAHEHAHDHDHDHDRSHGRHSGAQGHSHALDGSIERTPKKKPR